KRTDHSARHFLLRWKWMATAGHPPRRAGTSEDRRLPGQSTTLPRTRIEPAPYTTAVHEMGSCGLPLFPPSFDSANRGSIPTTAFCAVTIAHRNPGCRADHGCHAAPDSVMPRPV